MKARDLKCEICGKGMFEKTPLYRNGPIGEIVPWRCIEHVDEQYRPDKDTRALCDIIAGNAPAESKCGSADNSK